MAMPIDTSTFRGPSGAGWWCLGSGSTHSAHSRKTHGQFICVDVGCSGGHRRWFRDDGTEDHLNWLTPEILPPIPQNEAA